MPEKAEIETEKKLRTIVKEEVKGVLDNYEFHFQKEEGKKHEETEQTEKCEGCGTIIEGTPKYCPNCEGELDWPERPYE